MTTGLALLALAAPAAAGAKAPAMGRTAVVKPVSGKVLVGPTAKQLSRLRAKRSIRIGSVVDATRGKVRVTTAAGKRGKTQTGSFNGGLWSVDQKKSNALTELRLTGPDGCGSAKSAGVRSARRSK